MKWLRLGIGMLLIGFALLTAAGDVSSAGICDELFEADTRIRLLKNTQSRLSVLEEFQRRKVEDAQARAAAEPDRAQEIKQLESILDQKRQDVETKKRALEVTRREAANQDPLLLQAQVVEAQKKLDAERQKQKQLDAIESRLGTDPRVDDLRKQLQQARQDFQARAGDNKPQDILDFIDNFDDCGPPGTAVYDYCVERGRRKGFAASGPSISGTLGELEAKEKGLRPELRDLAKRLPSLEAELRKAEGDLLNEQDRKLRSQRDEIQASIARAEEDLAQIQGKLKLGRSYAERLAERVKDEETDLATLEQELTRLKQELEQKKGSKSPLEAAEADLRRVESELEQINKDLEAVEEYRTTLQKRLQPMTERLVMLADFARASGNRAGQAGPEKPAICQESRSAALDALKEASALAAENRACLNPSVLNRVNNGLQWADAIYCGGGGQPSGLIQVPLVKMGITQDEARGLLIGAGFTKIFFFEYRAPSSREDEGKVINVSPPPGQMVAPETRIVVSTFNNKWQEPEKAAEALSAAQAPGGAWDAEADKAVVSAVIRNPSKPDAQPSGPPPPTSSQVDRAREVAPEATARGPQEEPLITPGAIMGGLVLGTGIIASTKPGSGKTTGSTQAPPLTNIPSNPLPGVIPSTGTTGGRTAVPSGSIASTTREGGKNCTIHYSGAEGDAYYVIESGGTPKGFEIRKVWDPPRGDADRMQCGTNRGAMKKCIAESYRQMGKPGLVVLGPFTDLDRARSTANDRCR